jgi:SNF2 family DNA or RNA helicase
MSTRPHYQVGDRLTHVQFGTGLVVEVRERAFYDILEVAFQSGVRRLTSIHPDIVAGRDGQGGGASRAVSRSRSRSRRRAAARAQAAPLSETAVPSVSEPIPALAAVPERTGFQSPLLILDPSARRLLARHRGGRFDPPRAVRLRLLAEELLARRAPGTLIALDLSRGVIRYPHQEEAARRVVEEMRGRALLADEVGLGKTIEAGLVLSEFVLRGLVRRALILVPASLQRQWRDELRVKFGLHFHVRRRGERFRGHPLLITTLDTARLAKNREEILKQNYDLVVVDEAHRLKNHRTLSHGFVSGLACRRLLLITATPVQNDLRELYNLVTLLEPGVLDTFPTFRRKFIARGDRRLPQNTGELARLLSRVMVRTRREDTAIAFPKRTAETAVLSPSADEMALYQDVTRFVRDAVHRPAWNGGTSGSRLALLVLQKEIGSSPRAAVHTLEKLAGRSIDAPARAAARALADRARALVRTSKLDHLLELVRSTDEKVLVFTQFRGTMRYLAEALRGAGFEVETFCGGMSDQEREAAIDRFRDRIQILVSTDAGGEGRNLQFCRRIVNFDLPWNPMKVEQRIGRVHRLGQERDVFVHNYSARDTVEAYVLQILQSKLDMFALVVGELDMVLGHYPEAPALEETIFKLWTQSDDEREVERGFRRLGEELEIARERYEHVRDLDRQIFEALREALR